MVVLSLFFWIVGLVGSSGHVRVDLALRACMVFVPVSAMLCPTPPRENEAWTVCAFTFLRTL